MHLKTTNEMIELKDFQVRTGLHCESAAMMNALSYQGVNLSESMITGLGSAPGFFFSAEDAFPFMGARTHVMLENFCEATGIHVQSASPNTKQEAYDAVKTVLKTGTPVVLRVNMRYLPYLYGGKYGDKYTSFGWHFVCLVKIDETMGAAWVTDTTCREPQKIKLADLAKARDAKEGWLKTENFYYYFDRPSSVNIDDRAAFQKSMSKLIENFEAPDGGLDAQQKLPDQIRAIESRRNIYVLKPLFYTFYGYIEEFGSGGAAFRNFLRDYFMEMSGKLGIEELKQTASIVDDSCEAWKALAQEFKNISETIMDIKKDRSAREKLYDAAAQKAVNLYEAEMSVYEEVRRVYKA